MVKEIYNKLKKWDSTLINAHKLNFVHLNNAEFSELKNIYEENFNLKVTKSQLNCNSCRVKIVKELAKDYLATKEKELKSTIESNLTKAVKKGRPKKKVGRPKKIDIEQ